MEEVFEPVTEIQKQSQIQTKLESEKQLQALRDSTQPTTQATRESSNVLLKMFGVCFFKYSIIDIRSLKI